jgi:hypothetical protein
MLTNAKVGDVLLVERQHDSHLATVVRYTICGTTSTI